MGPFPSAEKYESILLAIDYVSKWVEAIPTRTNDHKVVIKFVQENIFSRFRCPRVIISDGGTHFTNKYFRELLKKNGVHHRVATPYHPQTNGPYVVEETYDHGAVMVKDPKSDHNFKVNGQRLKHYIEHERLTEKEILLLKEIQE
ncbi:unnamed protein product [Spirodela intermedia]|uniref:Integrase catalytic domain-containing protein n=1 Tax=Spirodela intermedia TaxID=51605 RepID=A0A7I8JSX8_SPIIN|nr:unnamed protein product [Spirodela intermedia]CAA6672851.1 unnamed protein product [Spirodela intermedia]